jgi:hypothetical protein
MTLAERFWIKVRKNGPIHPYDSSLGCCWIWIGAFSGGKRDKSKRYGSFWYNGSSVMSHRIALFLHTGELPEDLVACHSCDNPQCNNPHHLFWGTNEDNMQDMVRKGRHGATRKKMLSNA